MHLGDLSTLVNLTCGRENLCQLSVQPGDFPSLFINFLSRIHSVNFSQLSVRLGDHLSTSANFPCDRENFHEFSCGWNTFRQILSTFRTTRDLLSTSVTTLSSRETIRQLPSIFCAAVRFSVNFHQLSVPLGVFLSTSVTSPFGWDKFCEPLSNFRTAKRTSIHFCAAGKPSINLR